MRHQIDLSVLYDPSAYRHLLGKRVKIRRGTQLLAHGNAAGGRKVERTIHVTIEQLVPGREPENGRFGKPVIACWRGSGGRRKGVAAFKVEAD